MTIEEIEQEIIDEFSIYDDWMDKYAYLIELGSGLEGMDEAHKTEENLIKGCQSRVWFHADMRDGLLYFTADSDAIITKGIAGLLIRVFSGQKPADIAKADLHCCRGSFAKYEVRNFKRLKTDGYDCQYNKGSDY